VERLEEVDRLAIPHVRDVVDHELSDLLRVQRITDLRRVGLHRWIGPWEDAAVDTRVREDVGIQDVDQRGALVRADLDDLTLEELHRAAQEGHGPRRREAKGADAAELVEEGPDLVVVDAVAGLAEVAIIVDDRRRWGGRSRLVDHAADKGAGARDNVE